jgi:hypothetical protein
MGQLARGISPVSANACPEMVNLARVQKAANQTTGSEFKPETYGSYFEDLNLLPNAALPTRVIGREVPFLDRH